MKNILVTGADGFIGSHLVETLIKDGYSVKAFCLYNSFGSHGWLDCLGKNINDNIEFIMGDIRDSISVKNAAKNCDDLPSSTFESNSIALERMGWDGQGADKTH